MLGRADTVGAKSNAGLNTWIPYKAGISVVMVG